MFSQKVGEYGRNRWGDMNGICSKCWATCNVDMPGTFTANPEDAGMFYQWNRKTGWSSTDPMINSNGSTTWDPSNASGSTWASANDPCPTGWRVPTNAEHRSLLNAGSQWTTTNGVDGRIFGNGNDLLFLPAVGIRHYIVGANMGMGTGFYWSCTASPNRAFYLSFSSSGATDNDIPRSTGLSVRCIKE